MKNLALAIAMEAVYRKWYSYQTRQACVRHDTEWWADVLGVYTDGLRHVANI